MPTRLYHGSAVEQLESRRAEIALEQTALSEEHRELGRWINLKDMDVPAMKAEAARLNSIVEAAELSVEGEN